MCSVLRAMFRWLKCTATRDPVSAASLVCHDLTDGAGAASEAGAARTGSFHRALTSQNTNKNAFRVSHGECFDAEKIQNINIR